MGSLRARRFRIVAVVATLAVAAITARPAPAAPTGAHPRLWLDDELLARFQALAAEERSAVARAIARCADVRARPEQYARGGMGLDFGNVMSGCALAWKVTGNADDAATAVSYFHALLDDYEQFGDGGGGDDVVRHDTGYAYRGHAVYAAIGYDWLHDAPGVDDALLAHARARFKAWSDWYLVDGYLVHEPGANYQAGFVFGTTLIAIAEGGEAGADGDALWDYMLGTVFADEMLAAVSPGGVLEGGDWLEGWQYGPLSVMEYALSIRALRASRAARRSGSS